MAVQRLFSVDVPPKKGAILNADAQGGDIAEQLGPFSNSDFVAGSHVALHVSENDDITGEYVSLNAAAWPDDDLVIGCLDLAFDVALDAEILFREDLANDFYRLPDSRYTPRLLWG
jgi:hypothetical protein